MDLRNQFTDRARQAMQAAERAAHRLGHHAIDTELLLFALMADESGKAVEVLKHAGVDERKMRARLECTVQYASACAVDASHERKPTARTQSAIDYAIDEARNLNHNYVGSEHLLIGLLREGTGLAAEILREFGLTLSVLREETKSIIATESACKVPPPVTEAERQFFLALYKSAVALYKPRVEQKTGIELGEIAVWDYSCLAEHKVASRRADLSSSKASLFKRFFRRLSMPQFSEAIIRHVYAQRASECAATYYRGAIYVSFASGTAHDYAVAVTTVHEISHALWERIAEEDLAVAMARMAGTAEEQKYSLFVEGFATYAERIWFLDIYPLQIRALIRQDRLQPEGPHARGLRRVKWLIKKLGPDVFLEIPKKWRTLPEPESE